MPLKQCHAGSVNSDQTTDFANEVGKLRGLMEQVLDEVKATKEGVGMVKEMLVSKPESEEFDELKQDVKTIKTALTATNRDVAALDQRITRLEAA